MRYLRVAPWQCLTRLHGLQLTQRLPRRFDAAILREECRAVLARHPPRPHFRDTTAGWDGIGLVAPNGDPGEGRKLDAPYEKTEVLALAPYMESLIDSFPCRKKRVRLLQLVPGHPVPWHYDLAETLDRGNARLHVPIETNPHVMFQICHVDCHWRPGELWYGDFSFPHRLVNRGDAPRVHLVIDLVRNEAVDGLFGDEPGRQEALRGRVRPRAQALCRVLAQKPSRLRRKLRKRLPKLEAPLRSWKS